MESIAVTKPGMGVLSQERLLLSPFGALAQAFSQEILDRARKEEGRWSYVPLDLLEEGEESQTAPAVPPVIQVDLHLVLEALRREKGESEQRRAAERIVEEGYPTDVRGVRALPGVGDYTAGAISSIALGLAEPAVDGNVLRILSRLYADKSNVDEPATKARYAALLRAAYPKETGDFCEALMELGAIVCVPNGAPLCGGCPWAGLCRAHLANSEEDLPVRAPKKARRVVDARVAVLRCGGKYALEKRPAKGLLAGLWQFPFFEGEMPFFGETVAQKRAVHIFTHVEWRMEGRLVEVAAPLPQYVWASADEIKRIYALPSAFKAFMQWVI